MDCTFLHLHPTLAPDGTWTASDVTFDTGGLWAVVAEFNVTHPSEVSTSTNPAFQLGELIEVGGPASAELNWEILPTDDVDGYTVTVDGPAPIAGEPAQLTARVTDQAGQPAVLEEHMASGGHYIGFSTHSHDPGNPRTGRRVFVHTHHQGTEVPTGGAPLKFAPVFPKPGYYRVVIQFKIDGQVRDGEFFTYAYPDAASAASQTRPDPRTVLDQGLPTT